MSILSKVLRVGEGRKLKVVQAIVPYVNDLEPDMQRRSDAELRAFSDSLRERGAQGEDLDDLLPEAFALVREAAVRTLGQRHYDVQVMGGAGLHFGWVSEMKTGEGKTLVSTLPAYLNALSGKGVHIVTVNDYLARRDSEWVGRVHRFLGLEVGLVVPEIDDWDQKRAAYAADITYGTNNEFGFDYLRDNMADSRAAQVQRGHNFAIVDEIDSILIDEARTPLIISGRVDDAQDLYVQFARIVKMLERDEHYEVDEAKRTIVPTESGIARVESALGVSNLYEHVNQNFVHQLQAALKAKELFKNDVDYIVRDGEVHIVDEFTGRILEGRRWSEGLHQAVEAKEGVKIKEENQTLATVTLQNYFRMYDKLGGMTGTATTEAGEFAHTYGLEVVAIPTHQDVQRIDGADLIFKGEVAKYNAVVDDINERHTKGQPVLVGTISVEKSEYLAGLLKKRGIPHEVLNAKQHEREAHIITQAGRPYAVTVATNMAGRGVDILLGGNPEGLAQNEMFANGEDPEEHPEKYRQLVDRFAAECKEEGEYVRSLGGLYVLGTERHESRRIDNQLRGRSGRQGDPGETRFYLSLEDDLMRLFATGAMNWVMGRAFPDDVPLEAKMVSKSIERAQRTVEDRNFEIRKDVLKYDEVMNEQRKIIYERRNQILDGGDLGDDARSSVMTVVGALVLNALEGHDPTAWDLDDLIAEAATLYPTRLTVADIAGLPEEQVAERFAADALALYDEKEANLGPNVLREIERRVMLSVIDQRWREHLYEMDYLREGINLRAMGQQDPLAAWQREGFSMFESMMGLIEEDFARFISHVEVVVEAPQPAVSLDQLQYSASETPVGGSAAMALAASGSPEQVALEAEGGSESVVQQPRRVERGPGRNDPCPCGSGKKYKLCHGR